MEDFMDEFIQEILNTPIESDAEDADDEDAQSELDKWDLYDGGEEDANHQHESTGRRGVPNRFKYKFGNYLESNYYNKFLHEDVRQETYVRSQNCRSTFRSHFRVPLVFVDHLTDMFISREWVKKTKRCRTDHQLYVRTQLHIMCALEHLGNRKPLSQFETATNISSDQHRLFIKLFVKKLYEARAEFIRFPSTLDELKSVVSQYMNSNIFPALVVLLMSCM
jgi:hypothetical protein